MKRTLGVILIAIGLGWGLLAMALRVKLGNESTAPEAQDFISFITQLVLALAFLCAGVGVSLVRGRPVVPPAEQSRPTSLAVIILSLVLFVPALLGGLAFFFEQLTQPYGRTLVGVLGSSLCALVPGAIVFILVRDLVGRLPSRQRQASPPQASAAKEPRQLPTARRGAAGDSYAESVEQALQHGAVTLLLAEPLAPGVAGLKQLLVRSGMEALGMGLVFGPTPALKPPGCQWRLELIVGTRPFPSLGVDLRFSGLMPPCAAFLTLKRGTPETGASSQPEETWGARGRARWMTLVAARLLQQRLATGLILHAAGHVVYAADTWLARLDDPTRASCRPFGAWVDLGLSDQLLAIHGMEALGLPDVEVVLDETFGADEDVRFQRGQEAVLVACHRMSHGSRPLQPGEVLAVPLGVRVGSGPLEADNPGLTEQGAPRYRVMQSERRLCLQPESPIPTPASLWGQAAASGSTESMPYPAYRELLLGALEAQGWRQEAHLSFAQPKAPVPPHEVFVFRCPDGLYATITCGLGRRPQHNGSPEQGTAHVEFLLRLPIHQPALAQSLSLLGHVLHGRGEEEAPWGPSNRITFEEPLPPLRLRHLALAAAGQVPASPGPALCLLMPVILSAAERERLSQFELPRWLEANANTAEVQGRWRRALQALPSA